jgi:nitroreductase
MFNDTSSTLALLRSRRSGKARNLIAPGPDVDQLRDILTIAARVPDHGKLAPWRFVVIPPQERRAFADMIVAAYRAGRPDAGRLEITAMEDFALQAPTMVILISKPSDSSKIPLWEQQMSAGAAAMNLLVAAHAHGFVANWLTGWACESSRVAQALGADGVHDRIVGFFFIGTSVGQLEERPRPDMSQVSTEWTGSGGIG